MEIDKGGKQDTIIEIVEESHVARTAKNKKLLYHILQSTKDHSIAY